MSSLLRAKQALLVAAMTALLALSGMALVGCGPAYVFHFMDALAEAGVTMGFTRQEALELVTQLVLGSAKLAALPGSHPAILREQVCSPAGVTIAAVNHLDRTAVRGHLIDAVLAAYAKS